MGQILLQ